MSPCHTTLVPEDDYIEPGYFEGDDYFISGALTALNNLRMAYRQRHQVFLPGIVVSGGKVAVLDTDLDSCVGLVASVSGTASVLLSCDSTPVDIHLESGVPIRLGILQVKTAGTTATGIVTLFSP